MMFRALVVLILLGSLVSRYGCSRNQEQALSLLHVPSAELDVVSAEHRVEIRSYHADFLVKAPHSTVGGEKASGPDLQRRCKTLAREMSLYPRGFLNKVGIKTIVLCSKLMLNGQSVRGLAELESNTIYLDVALSEDEFLQCSVFHHEVFHFADWSDDFRIDRDPGWNALNQGFQYGQGGESKLWITRYEIGKPIPTGFLNWYSTSGIDEDKAEMFSYLTSNIELLKCHAQCDKIIEQKILAIQRIVRGIDREFGDSLWNSDQLR